MFNKILNRSLNAYLLFGAAIMLVLAAFRSGANSNFNFNNDVSYYAYSLNVFAFFSYYILLKLTLGLKTSACNSKNLARIVFLYLLIFVFICNWLFYTHHGTYLEFNSADSSFYHALSLKISSMSFAGGLTWLGKYVDFEEWGMFLYVSTLYRVIPSNLFVNFVNVVLGAASAVMLFKTMTFIIERKAAFMSALAFSCASFMFYFHASGLKESFFCFNVIGFFYYAYSYFFKRKLNLLAAILPFGFFIFILRPVVLAFAIAALAFLIFPKTTKSPYYLIVALVIIIASAFIFPDIYVSAKRYLSSTEAIMAGVSPAAKQAGSVQNAYSVSLLSSLIGPLPTFTFKGKENVFLYSTGLLLRVILSYYFFMGLWLIFKTRKTIMYPIAAFALFEMFSLAFILESFELRLNMPHFPFIYIISFFGIFMKSNKLYYKKYKFEKIYIIAIFAIVLVWNFRLN